MDDQVGRKLRLPKHNKQLDEEGCTNDSKNCLL